MSSAKNAQKLCELCDRIFRGRWQAREESVYSGNGSLEDGNDDNHFYERPDWLQIDGRVNLGTESTPIPKPSSPAHHSIPALEISAKNGCHLCVIIWDQLQSKLPDLTKSRRDNLNCAIGVVVARPAFDSVEDGEPRNGPEPVDLEILYFINGKCEIQDAYITTIGIDVQPAKGYLEDVDTVQSSTTKPTPSVVRHIQEWAFSCIKSHANCRIPSASQTNMPQDRRLPTRLLDVNIEQGDAFIRLQESHMIDPNAKYITLSHCWGSSLPVRLLQASYQQFCDHIPVSGLPRTFQDAIQFIRTLQIRFIWIDALCIVQDSKDDWLRESLQMASIYSYSWLNIAATSSADGHGGLFKTRNRLLPAGCQVNASWTGHMSGLYICFDQSAWARRVEDSHLNTRGWVLQERLLAPRNVHFAYDQIWWECRETRACEAFLNSIPDYVLHLDTEKAKLLVDLDPKDPLGSNEQWLGIVKIYTQTHLTKDSDRLIAIAGIASTVQNTLKWPANDYHAGLWRYDLPVDLLWRMATNGTRVKEYVAPSWSWASVKGEVYFNSSGNRAIIRKCSLIEIRKVETSLISGPFGPVASGSIQIRGSLHKICLNDVKDSANGRYITKLQISGVALSEDDFAEGLDDDELYVRGLTHPLQAFFCRFATFETPHMDEKYSSEGLILEAVDQDQAVYQRIGWMRIFHNEYDGPFRGQNAGSDRYVFRIV